MTKHDAILYIRDKLKNADSETLRRIICGINGPLCSNECPLRQNCSNCECEKITEDEE